MSPIESRRYNECSGCCFINNLRSLRTANDLVAFELGARSVLLKSCLVALTFTLCVYICVSLLCLLEEKMDGTKEYRECEVQEVCKSHCCK